MQPLEEDRCYRALGARDARFDGRFFVGVLTTGIYCRPICPARTPLRRNVRFYANAAGAAEAGFRPCLRCRPESSPGTPAWRGTSTTIARALRLVAEGALDRGSVEDLASTLGIGERHLRRLFREQVGASPVTVAQTRRLHFAMKLIDETPLPMTEVALTAGYASLRRFNAAIRETYGTTPSALRRGGPPPGVATGGRPDVLVLRLGYRAPLALPQLFDFLATRAIPGVERVQLGLYERTVRLDGVPAIVAVRRPRAGRSGARKRGRAPFLELCVPIDAARHLARLTAAARRIFDLDADPTAIAAQLRSDPLLAPRIERTRGLRVPGAWDGFELGVRAILGQQVSVAGASTLAGRLVERFGEALPRAIARPGLASLFPSAQRLANADIGAIGMPARRANAIRALARAVTDGVLDLRPEADIEAAREALRALPGVGPWTVEYIAMRALRDPDAFPTGDLVLRRAASSGAPLTTRALEARSEPWRPWRAYAALALWNQPEPVSAKRPARPRSAPSAARGAGR